VIVASRVKYTEMKNRSAKTKKISPAALHKFIHSLRGKYKHLPLMKTLEAIKLEEK
jgi:hypothetical protein